MGWVACVHHRQTGALMYKLSILALVLAGCMETGLQGSPSDVAGLETLDTGGFATVDGDPVDEDEGDDALPPEQPSEDVPPHEEPPVEQEPPPEDDCDHTSDLVYVIDRADDALYLFNPETMDFEILGEIDCGMFAGSPSSMSVARDGIAYVRYTDNTVYAVDLDTLECTETAYGGGGFGAFGMGFATDSDTTWRDTLYIANDNQLARMDTATWSVSPMGSLPSQSELTGNADGELWAILPLEEPAQLVRLNKDTAAVEYTLHMTAMPDPYTIDAFAFATWGGDFWVFIRTYGMGHSTDVYRVTSTGHTTRVAVDTGMDVVGAGVSTCAPTGA